MNNQFQVGDHVKGFYKTGVYIGEITDVKPMHYLVKILAVLTHPKQGDLHHPNQADVPFFMNEKRSLTVNRQISRTAWSSRSMKLYRIMRIRSAQL